MSYRDDLRGYFKIGRKEAPGIAACVLLAVISYIVARGTLFENGPRVIPAELFVSDPVLSALAKIGPIVLALLLGLPIALRTLSPGASYSSRYLLRLAIALMGARVTIDVISSASPIGMIIILVTMAFAMFLAFRLGDRWMLERDASALIGTGNAICGVSACMSVAPVVGARPHNLHAVIGVISLLGLVGVFIVPWLAAVAGLDDSQAAVLIGGSLHEVGNVVPAADIYSTIGGGDIMGLVLAYKMVRVAMLVVIAYYLARLLSRRAGAARERELVRPPGFLLAFVAVAVGVSLLLIIEPGAGDQVRTTLISVSASLLTVAMAGVGLSMDLPQMLSTGRRLLPATAIVWLAQLALLLALTMLLV